MPRHRARSFRIEALQSRLLLAVTYWLEDGILMIAGGDGWDVITLSSAPAIDRISFHGYTPSDRGGAVWQTYTRSEILGAKIWGGDGNDKIDCGAFDLPVTVYADAGDDLVNGSSTHDEIHGGRGRDTLRGLAGNDTIFGGADADRISLGSGDDLAYGGPGEDIIIGRRGSDLIYGEEGWDRLFGGDSSDGDETDLGADSLFGGPGNDSLYAGYGPSVLEGGEGNDYLYSKGLSDTLEGGPGDDRLVAGESTSVDFLYGGEGADFAWRVGPEDIIAPDVERIVFLGSTVEILIVNDQMRVHGTADNDVFVLTSEADDILLQFGIFQYSRPANGTASVGFWLDDGDDLLDAGQFDLPIIVFAGDGNDSIIGSSGNDEIHGGRGSDTLFGMDGDDTLFGGEGDDALYGGAGNDVLYGRAGADLIDGGDGEDAYEVDDDGILVDVEIALLD